MPYEPLTNWKGYQSSTDINMPWFNHRFCSMWKHNELKLWNYTAMFSYISGGWCCNCLPQVHNHSMWWHWQQQWYCPSVCLHTTGPTAWCVCLEQVKTQQ